MHELISVSLIIRMKVSSARIVEPLIRLPISRIVIISRTVDTSRMVVISRTVDTSRMVVINRMEDISSRHIIQVAMVTRHLLRTGI